MLANIKEKIKIKNWRIGPVGILAAIALVLFIAILILESREIKLQVPVQVAEVQTETPVQDAEEEPTRPVAAPYITPDTAMGRLTVFAKMHKLPLSEWPSSLIEFMEKYPETESYVMNYPFYKDVQVPIDLTSSLGADKMPLFLQWDARWGYTQYSGEFFATSGCGPTCLSMVALHLLQDATLTPRYVADFSQENGYYTEGMGSNWTLISEGGEQLGLEVEEIYLDKYTVMTELEAGNAIICSVGPGVFTYTGHFIVLSGIENGLIRINDPNSRVNSEQLWKYEQIEDQVLGIWACRLPQAEE